MSELEEEATDLRRQLSEFESFEKRTIWTVFEVGVLALAVVETIAYVMILRP